MKILKRVYKWIILSVVLQIAVLAYFNYDYLLKEHEIKATSYEVSDEVQENEKKSVKIEDGTSLHKVSYDGNHAAWLLSGKIHVYDLKNKKSEDIIEGSNGDINYYKWLPDRNIIIYSVSNAAGKINVLTKDIETGTIHDYPVISGLAKNSEVKDIELSPLTNVVYVKVQTSSTRARIYKYDIMDNLSYIMIFDSSSTIKEANLSDKLFYDEGNGRIMVWDGKRKSKSRISTEDKVFLIGVDAEDNLYVGNKDSGGKITKLLYSKQDKESDDKWYEINLKTPCDKNHLFVTKGGGVYMIDKVNKVVINLKNSVETKYEGEFIEILDNYIVYSDNNKLMVDSF
ncbi:MAG TPA: hypothetical protein VIO64_06680 [Pseudobacteroides sp.]|uniref:hypothetical protein n=1 Tax=Pseudobacteroides sp. TaxID=1968840 RepID=UPI002F9580BA